MKMNTRWRLAMSLSGSRPADSPSRLLDCGSRAGTADGACRHRRLVVGGDGGAGVGGVAEGGAGGLQRRHPNVTFTNNLLSTDALLPTYEAAGQAKQGPTIMYLWGGIYTMDAVWKGWIVPISDYVGMDEAAHYINNGEATWDGKIWSAAWYLQPSYPLVYNKEAFTAAGLDPAAPPQTWDDFLAACDAFQAKGMPFIGLGVKDTWGTGRFWMDSLVQQIDGVGTVLQTVSGDSSFVDTPYTNFFAKWKELVDHKCFPDDVASLDMYTGQQLVTQGKAGLTFITGLGAGLLHRLHRGREGRGDEAAGDGRRGLQGSTRLDLADAGRDLVGE